MYTKLFLACMYTFRRFRAIVCILKIKLPHDGKFCENYKISRGWYFLVLVWAFECYSFGDLKHARLANLTMKWQKIMGQNSCTILWSYIMCWRAFELQLWEKWPNAAKIHDKNNIISRNLGLHLF